MEIIAALDINGDTYDDLNVLLTSSMLHLLFLAATTDKAVPEKMVELHETLLRVVQKEYERRSEGERYAFMVKLSSICNKYSI